MSTRNKASKDRGNENYTTERRTTAVPTGWTSQPELLAPCVPATRRPDSYKVSKPVGRAQSRDSDWLRAEQPRGRSSSPERVKNFLFSMSSKPVMGPLSNGYRGKAAGA
jgi:hypothetical protein